MNSNGLARVSSGTTVSAHVVPLADDGEGKQQTGWYGMVKCRLDELERCPRPSRARPRAARVARIGARQVPTARVPVILSPDIAAAWIGEMFDAFSGEAHLKRTSWLTDRLGETIAAAAVTLVDDGRMPRAVGSEPFDGEGHADAPQRADRARALRHHPLRSLPRAPRRHALDRQRRARLLLDARHRLAQPLPRGRRPRAPRPSWRGWSAASTWTTRARTDSTPRPATTPSRRRASGSSTARRPSRSRA